MANSPNGYERWRRAADIAYHFGPNQVWDALVEASASIYLGDPFVGKYDGLLLAYSLLTGVPEEAIDRRVGAENRRRRQLAREAAALIPS